MGLRSAVLAMLECEKVQDRGQEQAGRKILCYNPACQVAGEGNLQALAQPLPEKLHEPNGLLEDGESLQQQR